MQCLKCDGEEFRFAMVEINFSPKSRQEKKIVSSCAYVCENCGELLMDTEMMKDLLKICKKEENEDE